MEYTTLGSTGMTVSRIGLGCLSLGKWSDWTFGEDESHEIVDRAIDLGINFFDTANNYATGRSEEILGAALSGYDRDDLVVATKGYFSMDDDNPNASGLSRKAIEQELEHSLERLGMDTIDLYQTHRWDHDTPVEETMRTLDDAVRRGQVRYLGASTLWAYQLAEALHASERLGLERFATVQNQYNLVFREDEREMLPLCDREGVGVLPWGPLAQGYLTRPHDALTDTERGERLVDRAEAYRSGGGLEINARVEELAEEKGVTMAQIALAWHLHNEFVDAPIVGVSSIEQLEQAVEAVDITLSDSELAYLEEPYEPVQITRDEPVVGL